MEGPWAGLPEDEAACTENVECADMLRTLWDACVSRGDCDASSEVASLLETSVARERLVGCQAGVCRCTWVFGRDGMSCTEPSLRSREGAVFYAVLAAVSLVLCVAALVPLLQLRGRGPLPIRAAEAVIILCALGLFSLFVHSMASAAALVLPVTTLYGFMELCGSFAMVLFFLMLAVLRLAVTWVSLAAAARGGSRDAMGGGLESFLRKPRAAYVTGGVWLLVTSIVGIFERRGTGLPMSAGLIVFLAAALAAASSRLHFLFRRAAEPKSCGARLRFFADAMAGAPLLGRPLSALANDPPESAAALAKRHRQQALQGTGMSVSSVSLSSSTRGPLDDQGDVDSRGGGGAGMRKFSARVLACAFRLVFVLLALAICLAVAAAAQLGGNVVSAAGARWAWAAAHALCCMAFALVYGFFRESYSARVEAARAAARRPAVGQGAAFVAGTRRLSARASLSESLPPDTLLDSGALWPSRVAGSAMSTRSWASGPESPDAAAREAARRHTSI